MARRVYFDPFGMRTEGYRAGVQDETGIQNATRQARYSDAMFPFTVNRARREDQFEAANLPRRQRAADIGLYNLEQPILRDFGRLTGQWAPAVRNDFNIVGAQFGTRPGQTFDDGVDAAGNPMRYTELVPYVQLQDFYGQYQDIDPNFQNLIDAYQTEAFRPQAIQDAATQLQYDEFGLRQQEAQLRYMQTMEELRRRQEQLRMIRELQRLGYYVSPISGQVINPQGAPGGEQIVYGD